MEINFLWNSFVSVLRQRSDNRSCENPRSNCFFIDSAYAESELPKGEAKTRVWQDSNEIQMTESTERSHPSIHQHGLNLYLTGLMPAIIYYHFRVQSPINLSLLNTHKSKSEAEVTKPI